jgi:hypothetical protein
MSDASPPPLPNVSPRDVGADFDYRPAWRRGDAAIEADAIAFWDRLGILPAGVAPETRAKELAAAAYQDGRLVGVSTVTLARLEFLRARFAMLRVAVDPDHRRGRAAWGLALFTRQVMEAWSKAHPEEKVAGLAAILEAAQLEGKAKEPFWVTTRLGLVGHTKDGRQIRVSWFEDFRLD